MPTAKIYLDPGETIEEAKELLAKALSLDNSIDHTEKYADPLAEAHLTAVNESVKLLYQKMFQEIGEVLAKDIYGL
jgi:molybdenum cofactor biosynthesis enzyme MoaA